MPVTDGIILATALIVLVVIFGSVWMIKYIITINVEKKVRSTSKRFLYALSVFNKIEIIPLNQSYTFTRRMPTKSSLDTLNANQQIINMIAQNPTLYNYVQLGINNRDKQKWFYEQMKKAPEETSTEDAKRITTFCKKYIQKERDLVNGFSNTISLNIPQFRFIFTYTSPKGRNSYKSEYSASIETLSYFIWLIKNESLLKNSAQHQRSLMNKSLRYDVMKRDGFRCVLCGRSASDMVKLHVDHIKPISKGGKTELSNLRTLCQDCNLGKRDKFSPKGYN